MQHFTYTKHANKRHHFLSSVVRLATKKTSEGTRGSKGRIEKTAYCRSFTDCTPPNIM